MMQWIHIVRPIRLASTYLAGGLAPATWLRAARHYQMRAAQLGRASAWTDFLSHARPHLRGCPLFGCVLEGAAGAPPPPLGSDPPVPTRRRTAEEFPRTLEIKRARRPAAVPPGIARKRRDGFVQLDRELLVHLAGSPLAEPAIRADHIPLGPVRRSGVAGAPGTPSGNTTRLKVPALKRPAHARRALAEILVRRTANTLNRFEPLPGFRSAILVDQWSSPLDRPGITAEFELITISEGAGRPSVSEPASDDRLERIHSDDSPGPKGLPASALQSEVGADMPRDRSPQQQREFPSPDRQLLPSRTAPPSVPPQTRGDATGSMRIDTAEAASFDWNLTALSTAMKRILDEEARRMGIDV